MTMRGGWLGLAGPLVPLQGESMRALWLIAIATILAGWFIGARTVRADASDDAHPKVDANTLRQAAMNSGGNADQGKKVFLSPKAQCAPCHKIHGQGGDVGPDLSQIGGKFDRTHLIESILDPSAEILQDCQATIIECKSGKA